MKFKLTVLLATFVVTMGLLLGASTAQAQTEVILNEADDSVIKILNLPVVDGDETVTVYNVDFVDATAEELYGPDLVSDFPDEEDLGLAFIAVNNALNEASTIPLFAGPLGSDRFLIGETEEDGLMAGLGSENITGSEWDFCRGEGTPRCITGAVAVQRNNTFTWASFTEAGEVPESESVTIGGSVFGLVGIGLEGIGLVLQNNGGDDLSIDGDGAFEFTAPVKVGDPYEVTVFTQPPGQFCRVLNGSDVAPDVDVTNVFVICGAQPDPVSIGGRVYGVDDDDVLLLANNDTDFLLQVGNGDYVFEQELMPGDSYNVSVPFIFPEQTCSVANSSGEVPDENVTNVLVACGPVFEVTIGGTVTGLESDSGLVLQNNGADDKPIAADGTFTFDEPLLAGSTYSVTVLINPTNPAQECFVSGGSGPVPFQDVTNVAVTCAPSDDGPPPPDSNTVCEREECLSDPEKLAQCNEMMEECLATAEDNFDIEQCTGMALLTCGLF